MRVGIFYFNVFVPSAITFHFSLQCFRIRPRLKQSHRVHTAEDCVQFDGLYEVLDVQHQRLTVDLFHWVLSGNFRTHLMTSLSTSSTNSPLCHRPFSAFLSSVSHQVKECSLLQACQLRYCLLCQLYEQGNGKSLFSGGKETTSL